MKRYQNFSFLSYLSEIPFARGEKMARDISQYTKKAANAAQQNLLLSLLFLLQHYFGYQQKNLLSSGPLGNKLTVLLGRGSSAAHQPQMAL